MTSSECHIPWSDVGTEYASELVAVSDELSRKMKEALAGVCGPGIPDFEDRRWRYELCIFTMFWMWYVANSPTLTNGGATKPLLDAYHRACSEAMVRARLIENSEEAIRRWEDELQDRFLAYKNAYDAELEKEQQDPHLDALRFTGRGTVGWLFVRYLFPGQQPSVRLVLLLNEFGSTRLAGLAEMFKSLEAHYHHGAGGTKRWWKLWK